MREDTPNTTSVLDDLSSTAAESQSESYDRSFGSLEDAVATTAAVDRDLDTLLEQVTRALSTDEVQFDEALIKENLDEILLLLIALRGETHGKELLSDLTRLFDAQLSPGTVYPALHALNEDGVLAMHTKIRTKEYSIADEASVRETLEETMVQHLAFGLLLSRFLSER